MKEHIQIVDSPTIQPTLGSCGMQTQVSGGVCTVSAVAAASGGIGRGHLIETDN